MESFLFFLIWGLEKKKLSQAFSVCVWFRVSAGETHVSTLMTWFLSCAILFGFHLQNRFSLPKAILAEARNRNFCVKPILPFVVVEIYKICFIPSLPFSCWLMFTVNTINCIASLFWPSLSRLHLVVFLSIVSGAATAFQHKVRDEGGSGLKNKNPFIFKFCYSPNKFRSHPTKLTKIPLR